MKLFSKHFNYWWLLLLILLIPIIALATTYRIDTLSGGHRIYRSTQSDPIFHITINNRDATLSRSTLGMCLQNDSTTTDYFIPTGTLNEWNSVYDNWISNYVDLYPVTCCGDYNCETGETVAGCPSDCKISVVCGDGVCSNAETIGKDLYCSQDCPMCGDHICNDADGETCGNSSAPDALDCLPDCGRCAVCGNGICETALGEIKGTGDSYPKCKTDCGLLGCTTLDNCDSSSNEYCNKDASCYGGEYYAGGGWHQCSDSPGYGSCPSGFGSVCTWGAPNVCECINSVCHK